MKRPVSVPVLRFALLLMIWLGLSLPAAMAQADQQGQWSTLSYTMPINPIHVALMHNGKILVTRVRGTVLLPIGLSVGTSVWRVERLGCGGARSGGAEHHSAVGVVGHVLQRHDGAAGWTGVHQRRHARLRSFNGQPKISIFDPADQHLHRRARTWRTAAGIRP